MSQAVCAAAHIGNQCLVGIETVFFFKGRLCLIQSLLRSPAQDVLEGDPSSLFLLFHIFTCIT